MSFKISLVNLPLLAPFSSSIGTEPSKSALILKWQSDGVRAFSECFAPGNASYYGLKDGGDEEETLRIIKNQLYRVLMEKTSPEEFLEKVNKKLRGYSAAKAAVEMLLWDYHAKLKKESLSEALGEPRGYAEVGISLGIEKTQEMVKRVGEAVENGYRRVKVKIEKGREYEILSSVRDAFPNVPLSADANCSYTLKDLDALKRIDGFDLEYLEQPLGRDDIVGHAKLSRELATPICLDESISSVDRAREALDTGAARVVNIKPARLGGLLNSLRVAGIVRERGGHSWVGGMLETGVGRAFNVALASHRSIDYPGDTSPNGRYFSKDIVKNPFLMTKKDRGRMRPNPGPGIGVVLDDAFLNEITARRWEVS